METLRPEKALVLQTNFACLPTHQEITFDFAPSRLLPVGAGQKFSLKNFADYFINNEQQLFMDFFSPDSWAQNKIILTMSTEPGDHLKGESCSVFIAQNGKDHNNNLLGTMINLSLFLPGDFLYKDLAVYVDGLNQFRKITHDFNNQFQIITGFGSALEDEITDPELKECATNVMDAVDKAVEQNKELRKFFPPSNKPRLFFPCNNNLQSIAASTNLSANAETQSNQIEAPKSAPTFSAVNEGSGILVIDDEPLVERFLCEMLKRLKYNTTGCGNGTDAIAALKQDPQSFSLAIVDMNLPDITSETLYDQLIQLKPDLKVILISGDSLGENAQRILGKGAHGFLQKPTTIKTLAETIGQILSGVAV